MKPPVARYAVTFGLSGCYMPDSHFGPIICSTRRELMQVIRAEIESAGFPACTIRQVKATRLWQFIKRNGSSVAHFSVTHGAYEIGFHGLTEEEAEQMEHADS